MNQHPKSQQRGKIIIMSAPSGAGKSTIIKKLMEDPELKLGFSISATSRQPRGEEKHGREYYFLSATEFAEKARKGEFVEWEEVYSGTFYGTLRSEVERVLSSGKNLIMDIDVKGGVNVKQRFGANAFSIFVMPPSMDALKDRLLARGSDSPESVQKRLDKAEYEMSFAPMFDRKVVNDKLDDAVEATRAMIKEFIAE